MPVSTRFLLLVLAQAAHSIEEYLLRLYEVFAPARFVSGLISDDHERGFIIANVSFFVFGMWSYRWPVRGEWPAGVRLAWLWAIVEVSNGIVHPGASLYRGSYVPGTATSLVLLVLAVYLIRGLRENPS
jgi:hypothetical protein